MYGFPEPKVLADMVDKNLTMVCCNANQLYLHFDSDIAITVNKNRFQIELEEKSFEIGIPIDNLLVFKLIEKRVVKVDVNSEKTLCTIHFENDAKVILEDDKQYESFVITINQKEIIV